MSRLFIFLFGLMIVAAEARTDSQSAKKAQSVIRVIDLPARIQSISHYSIRSRVDKALGDTVQAIRKESWDWGAGVYLYGLVSAYQKIGDPAILNFIKNWIDFHLSAGIQLTHTDQIALAAVIAELMLHNDLPPNDPRYQAILQQAFNFLMSEQAKVMGCKDARGQSKKARLQWRGRAWLDDLFMTAPFMTRWSILRQKPQILNTIANHFLAHRDILQCHKKDSYLLRHGTYLSKDYKLWFFPLGWLPDGNVAWARGHGWYLAALADFLAHLPEESEILPELEAHYQSLTDEIIGYQLASGLMPTVLDDSTSYGEVSATALLVYATAIAVQNHWLAGDRYDRFIRQGVVGILQHCSADGQITGVSAGTGVFPRAFLYKMRPRGSYPWGEGSVLLALTAVMDFAESF